MDMNLVELFKFLDDMGKKVSPECQVVARAANENLHLYFIWPNGFQALRVIPGLLLLDYEGDLQALEDITIRFIEREYKIAEVGEE